MSEEELLAITEEARDEAGKASQKLELARKAFGMWAEREDIDDEWLARNRRQWYSVWAREGATGDG